MEMKTKTVRGTITNTTEESTIMKAVILLDNFDLLLSIRNGF